MKTLVFRGKETVNGIYPLSGYHTIKMLAQGNRSGVTDLSFRISVAPSYPATAIIVGGVFIEDTEEKTTVSFMSGSTVKTIGVKVTADIAYIMTLHSAGIILKETNASTRGVNAPLVDYSYRVENLTDLATMFQGRTEFNQSLAGFKTPQSGSYTASNFLQGCTSFNQSLESLTFLGCTSMQSLLSDARSFAQDISHFQTGTVTNMNLMLSNTYALKNLDFSKWVFNLNVTLTSFVANSGLNPTSYDSLLIRLDGTDFTGRTAAKVLGATLVKYSSAGAAARASLITKGWTITDGGQA